MPATGNRRDDLLRDQLPPEEVVLPGAGDVDPATHALLTVGRKRSRVRRRTVAQKRKEIYDRQRERVIYDIPQSVKETLRGLAERLGCSASDLAALALVQWLNSANIGELKEMRVETSERNFRFRYTFDLPPLRVAADPQAKGDQADDIVARARCHLKG
ncbi:MAG: hypothetical protein H8D78_18800 [Chloroflexi bacterium]|nr:hypothetical protein [Chloroflexota bacterium]